MAKSTPPVDLDQSKWPRGYAREVEIARDLLEIKKQEESIAKRISKHEADILKTMGQQETYDLAKKNALIAEEDVRERIKDEIDELASIERELARDKAEQLGLVEEMLPFEDKIRNIASKRAKLQADIFAYQQLGLNKSVEVLQNEEKALKTLQSRWQSAQKFKKNLEDTKKVQEEQKKLEEESLELFGLTTERVKEFGATIDKYVTKPWLLITILVGMAIKKFIDMQEAGDAFRKSTGLTVAQTEQLDEEVRNVARDLRPLGVTIEEAYASAGALYEQFGNTALVNEKNVRFVADMAARLGVSEKAGAEFAASMFAAGGDVEKLSSNLETLATTSGVSVKQVMEDMAEASGDGYSFMSKSPQAFMRTAVEARKLGMSMQRMSDIAGELLSIEESLGAEMEANILTGQAINLDAARYYALLGDQESMLKEITNQFTSIDQFNRMGPIAQQSYAKALGMTVKELAEAIKLREVDRNLTSEQRKEREEAAKKEATILGNWKRMEEAVKTITSNLASIFLPVIELALPVMGGIADAVSAIHKVLSDNKPIAYALLAIGAGLVLFLKWHSAILALKTAWTSVSGVFGAAADRWAGRTIATPKAKTTGGVGGGGVGGGSTSDLAKNFTKFMKVSNPANILATGAALMMFAGSIWILSKAFENFTKTSWDGLVKGIIAMGLFTVAFMGISSALTAAGPVMLAGTVVLLAFAGALWIMSEAMVNIANSADGLVKILGKLMQVNPIQLGATGVALGVVGQGLSVFGIGAGIAGLVGSVFGGGETTSTSSRTSKTMDDVWYKLDEVKSAVEKGLTVNLDGKLVNRQLALAKGSI